MFKVPEWHWPYLAPGRGRQRPFPLRSLMEEALTALPKHGFPSLGAELLVHLHLPSGGSRPLGPEGWNPPRAHSIICLFCTSTALAVSLSSLSWHIGNSFPARLLATWRATRVGRVAKVGSGKRWEKVQKGDE